jgi:hypothetical protein
MTELQQVDVAELAAVEGGIGFLARAGIALLAYAMSSC